MARHLLTREHKPARNRNASRGRSSEAGLAAIIPQDGGVEVDFEREFLLSMGWAPRLVHDLEAKARNARVGLIQTAIASGVLQASEFYHWLSQTFCFAGENLPYRVHLPSAPEEAWLLMDRPVPLTAAGAQVVALNGQTSSIHTLLALSRKLGYKKTAPQAHYPSGAYRFCDALSRRSPGSESRRWSAVQMAGLERQNWPRILAGLFWGSHIRPQSGCARDRASRSANAFGGCAFACLPFGHRLEVCGRC